MSTGNRIEGILMLNTSQFTAGINSAKTQIATLLAEANKLTGSLGGVTKSSGQFNQSLDKTRYSLQAGTGGLTQYQQKINEAQSAFGGLTNAQKTAGQQYLQSNQKIQQTSNVVDNARESMRQATNATQTFSNSLGMLKTIASSFLFVIGARVATDIMTVANTAINADNKIRTMGKGMGWTTAQTNKFIARSQELQSVYRKTDMNQVAMEVSKMARIYKLNNDEATNFIETSAVFTSAMAEEGRTARDSALALKDLIDQGQGWERRLSEIGVTKEALENAGWSGNKEDKKGIIAALQKVLDERQLSQMAKEITNLDDAFKVLTISGGQFLGSVLIPITPYIYQAVRGLSDLAYSVRDTIGWLMNSFNNLPDFAQTAIKIGLVTTAFGGLGIVIGTKVIPSIMALKEAGGLGAFLQTSLGLNDKQFGLVGRLGLVAAGIGAITFSMYELGKAMGWWKDFNGMLGNTGAQIALVGSSIGLFALQFRGVFSKIAGWSGLTSIFEKLLVKIGITTAANEALNKSLDKTNAKASGQTTKGGAGGFKDTIKGNLKSIGTGTVTAAAGIAAGMGLATEALYLMQAPLWALAELGKTFKAKEASIRAGAEAFKTVGGVLALVLPPIIAFAYFMGSTGNSAFIPLAIGSVGAAAGIAIAMGLATEAIYLMKAPLWAIGELGTDFLNNQSNILAGLNVFKVVSDTLVQAAPLIISFGVAVLLFGSIPLAGLAAAMGIGITLGLVTQAISGLKEPLRKLAELGGEFKNLDQVKAGAEAIKRASEAVGYIGDIKVDIARMNVADGISALVEVFTNQKSSLKTLTAENGVLTDIKDFVVAFNKATVDMPKINNVSALKNVVSVVKDVSTLSTDIKNALSNTNKAKSEALFVNGLKNGDDSPFNAMGNIIESVINFTKDIDKKLARLPKMDLSGKIAPIKSVASMIKSVSDLTNGINNSLKSINTAKGNTTISIDNPNASPFTAMGRTIESVINFMKDMQAKMGAIPDVKIINLAGVIANVGSISTLAGRIKTAVPLLTGIPKTDGSYFGKAYTFIQGLNNFVNKIPQSTALNLAGVISDIGSIGIMAGRINTAVPLLNSIPPASEGSYFGKAYTFLQGMNSFISKVNASNTVGLTDVSGVIGGVNTMITQIRTAISNANGIQGAAHSLGAKIPSGIKSGLGNGASLGASIVTQITTAINGRNGFMTSSGRRLGTSLANGFRSSAVQLKTIAAAEVNWALHAINSRASAFWTAGARLGASFSGGYKSAMDINSPGIVARLTAGEVDYTLGFLTNAIPMAYSSASKLGQGIISGFGSPNLVVGDTEGLNTVQSNAQAVMGLAQNTTDTTTSLFSGMDNTLLTTFVGLANTTRNTFSGINTNTNVQMKDMAGKTTSQIGNIKTSWGLMQEALINSAANIRSKTGAHINRLQTNMASFWKKVRSPVLLLGGAAGGYAGIPMHKTFKSAMINNRLGGYAGSPSISSVRPSTPSFRGYAGNPLADENITGDKGVNLLRKDNPFPCFDANCYAGWELSNWTPNIKNRVGKWNTNFGHVYDPYLNVGKFTNSNFPVKGNPSVFKAFIMDAIGRTNYQFYYNSKGGSPASIYSSGSFNCFDGYSIVEGFANAFGLPCSMARGTWNGVPHVWANVGGVGPVDATAIQNRGSLFASNAVRAAGPAPRNYNTDNEKIVEKKIVKHYTVKVDLSGATVYGVDDLNNKINNAAEEAALKLQDINPNTGE